MEFITVRDLRSDLANTWDRLERDGKMVLTNNGKPMALMINLANQNFESILDSVNQAEYVRSVNNMRQIAVANDYMTEDEIEAEIRASRAERSARRQNS